MSALASLLCRRTSAAAAAPRRGLSQSATHTTDKHPFQHQHGPQHGHDHGSPHKVPDAEVLIEQRSHLLSATLNRPKALNALNHNMIRLMYPRYKEAEADDGTAAIVLKGAGEKAFCAGGDIIAIYNAGKSGAVDDALGFFREEYRLNHLIGTMKKPHIALIGGITMGGGVGLSVHGRFRVATESTVFAMPETGIGFFCDVGGSYFLPRLQGGLGMWLALTGHRLKGADVYAAGIATHFMSNKELHGFEAALTQEAVHHKGKLNDEIIASVLQKHSQRDVSSASLAALRPHIDRCFSADSVPAIFRELQRDGSPFATDALRTLQAMSPTALCVVFEQLRRGAAAADLRRCLQMEYRMAAAFVRRPKSDFFEGVRALLVDKDKNPRWAPASVDDVDAATVESFFASNGKDELHL